MIKKVVIAICLIPFLIVMLIISGFIFSPIFNDISLSNFAKQLNKSPLPEGTVLIEDHAVCGKLNGNGNGIDFFACILVKSSLSLEDLKKHYEKIKFKNAKSSGEYDVSIEVLPANNYKLETEELEHRDIYFDALKDISDYSGYYVVKIYDGGYPAFLDIRGN